MFLVNQSYLVDFKMAHLFQVARPSAELVCHHPSLGRWPYLQAIIEPEEFLLQTLWATQEQGRLFHWSYSSPSKKQRRNNSSFKESFWVSDYPTKLPERSFRCGNSNLRNQIMPQDWESATPEEIWLQVLRQAQSFLQKICTVQWWILGMHHQTFYLLLLPWCWYL